MELEIDSFLATHFEPATAGRPDVSATALAAAFAVLALLDLLVWRKAARNQPTI